MIYLDNAATTFPKPESVAEKMNYINKYMMINTGRGSYRMAREGAAVIDETKREIAALVHKTLPDDVVLAPSVTVALNQILRGIELKEGDYVYLTPYEHNAVARTVKALEREKKILVKLMPLRKDDTIDIEKLAYECRIDKPKCVCINHVSNVTGYILPVEEIIEAVSFCNPVIVVDAAQSMGLIPVDTRKIKADFIAFAGHKNLYGPLGIGGFVCNSDYRLSVVLTGGTGSDSLNTDMPQAGSGRYECASPNISAIGGLCAALKWRREKNVDAALYEQERMLTTYLVEGLEKIPGVHLYLPPLQQHIGVVSFNVEGYQSADVGIILDEDYDIAVRTGYHCAPYIHDILGDREYMGTIRASVGYFTTKEDIDRIIEAVGEIAGE